MCRYKAQIPVKECFLCTVPLVQFIIQTKKYCAFVGLDNNLLNKLHYKMFITWRRLD